MVNVDLLVAGCDTRCRHCYVNGGPMPRMETADALLCIERLDAASALLAEETNFTLDHEPMAHPEIERILATAAATKHIRYYHHGMTTGVALMRRADRDAVLDRYFAIGCSWFGLTVHGGEALHDEIVRRKGAFQSLLKAGEFLKARGAELEVSLMLNRFFPENADAISKLLDRLQPDRVLLVIPIATPHAHMADFDPYRPTFDTADALVPYLSAWRQNADEWIAQARNSTVSAALYTLETVDLHELFRKEQGEKYLCVHPDRRLFLGNSGAETQCLGDILCLDPAQIADAIRSMPDNRDYGAFYDENALPDADALKAALLGLPQNELYGDFPSVLYKGLDALGISTKILDLKGTACC